MRDISNIKDLLVGADVGCGCEKVLIKAAFSLTLNPVKLT